MSVINSTTLATQIAAAWAAYTAVGSLTQATLDDLDEMNTLFNTALTSALSLMSTIQTGFNALSVPALFASGVNTDAMIVSLNSFATTSAALVAITDTVARLNRALVLIKQAGAYPSTVGPIDYAVSVATA